MYSNSAYVDTDDFSDDEQISRRNVVKSNIEFKYKTRNRHPTRHVYIPRHKLNESSVLPVKLVPIKLEIDLDQLKITDVFTWNLNGTAAAEERVFIAGRTAHYA